MAIFRIEKTKNYTVMSNHHLKEQKMSLKAKGLLCLMLSLPDDWDYSIAGLVAICKENESAVKTTLKELGEFGYLRINKIYPDKSESGRIEYEYQVFENPIKQGDQIQGVENLSLEFQGVENPPQLNTNKSNTKTKNTKDIPPGEPTALIPNISKKDKKSKDIATMRSMISAFTQNTDIRKKLTDYFNLRIKKGLQPNQWQIILDDLRKFAGTDGDLAMEKIDGAIAGGYMQIIASWEKDKQKSVSKPSFDNMAGKKVPSFDPNKDKLATGADGNLIKF